MPTSLLASININPRTLRILAILLLLPFTFYAQQLTGLWTGSLSNDSNTIRKDQSFEIALTEYRGKVYGYSRSEFIVNDTLYYVVKRVKGTIDGDICEVKDDEIIAFNFPTKLDKGVKVVSTFIRNKKDSTWYLAGKWKTNQTKKYYSVSGKVDLQEEKELSMSKIFPHLEELNLTSDIPFYNEYKKVPETVVKIRPVIADKKTEPVINNEGKSTTDIAASVASETQHEVVNKIPKAIKDVAVKNEKDKLITSTINPSLSLITDIKKESNSNTQPEKIKPVPVDVNSTTALTPGIKEESKSKIISEKDKPITIALNSTAVTSPPKGASTKTEVIKNDVATKSAIKKEEPNTLAVTASIVSIKPNTTENKKQEITSLPGKPQGEMIVTNKIPEKKEPIVQAIAKTEIKKQPIDANGPAALVNERKSEITQEVSFKSDSLELSLYDNGEIDGDTVSVLLNGEVILAKQGLKATAIKKTIYIPAGNTDSLVLVLYAENLGKYPPNTGLMIVHDGDDVYQVRFSADLQKNAGVIFRKKKN